VNAHRFYASCLFGIVDIVIHILQCIDINDYMTVKQRKKFYRLSHFCDGQPFPLDENLSDIELWVHYFEDYLKWLKRVRPGCIK
jgi:hypothetical protein